MPSDRFEPMVRLSRLADRNKELLEQIDSIKKFHEEKSLSVNVSFSDGYDSYRITSIKTFGEDGIVNEIIKGLNKEYEINMKEIRDLMGGK